MYFPTLDGLRLCAFLLVLVHHLPRSTQPVLGFLHDCGWVGVSVFLTLSAYLLTAILCAEYAATGGVSALKFYVRRGLRIWPLYYAYLLMVGVFVCVRLPLNGNDAFRFAGLTFFIDNIVSGLRGYNPLPFTAHLWTVALEEQFYLILPFVLSVWLRNRRAAVIKIALVWVVFIVARAACVLLGVPHPFIWTSVISGDTMLIGIALALSGWKPPPGNGWRLLCVAGALLGIFSVGFMPPISEIGPHQVLMYATVAIGTGFLCVVALHEPAFAVLGARQVRYLGKISYGLYVFHFIGIALGHAILRRLGGSSWFAHAATSLACTVVLAALSYQFLEKPFLKLKVRFETVRTRIA